MEHLRNDALKLPRGMSSWEELFNLDNVDCHPSWKVSHKLQVNASQDHVLSKKSKFPSLGLVLDSASMSSKVLD